MTTKHWLLTVLKIVSLIAFYYLMSIGITFYNQNFVHHFNFPLTLTLCHFVIKFMIASFFRSILMWRGSVRLVHLSWKQCLVRILPTAVAGSFDIGLSNWSFEFVSISLYTMTKSSAILFILFFSVVFRIEKARWSTGALVVLIAGGLFLFTYRSSQFSLGGFILVLLASCLSGVRWSLTQLVMQKAEIGLKNPLDLMYHIQPFMAISILPLAVITEGVDFAISPYFFAFGLREKDGAVSLAIFLILLGSVLAFLLELAEFLLVCNTSSLTLSISGIFKELCTLLLASYYKNDQISAINWVGVALCLCGIGLHTYFKFKQGRKDAEAEPDENNELLEMSPFSAHVESDCDEAEPLITSDGAGFNDIFAESGESYNSAEVQDVSDSVIFSATTLLRHNAASSE